MDLTKQYVILWLASEAASLFLPRADDSRVWGLAGQVQGETSGVGLWLRVEAVASAPGEFTPNPEPFVTFLIPWQSVRAAQLLGAKLSDIHRPPGFLP
jgi:hypothetical protein